MPSLTATHRFVSLTRTAGVAKAKRAKKKRANKKKKGR